MIRILVATLFLFANAMVVSAKSVPSLTSCVDPIRATTDGLFYPAGCSIVFAFCRLQLDFTSIQDEIFQDFELEDTNIISVDHCKGTSEVGINMERLHMFWYFHGADQVDTVGIVYNYYSDGVGNSRRLMSRSYFRRVKVMCEGATVVPLFDDDPETEREDDEPAANLVIHGLNVTIEGTPLHCIEELADSSAASEGGWAKYVFKLLFPNCD